MASAFHNLWTKGAKQAAQLRFISIENEKLTMARLAMVQSYLIVGPLDLRLWELLQLMK